MSDPLATLTLSELETFWGPGLATCRHTCATIKPGAAAAPGPELAVKRHLVAAPGNVVAGADYELLRPLGAGGMSVVYEGRQAAVDRLVAVKTIKGEESPERRASFLAEATVIGSLEHPHIVPIYDLGCDQDGHLFYAMKRVRGRAWGESFERNDRDTNLRILLRVAEAVVYAHARGVLHRALKPDNVMLGEAGEVRVTDWDLAIGDPRPGATSGKAPALDPVSVKAGTPAYMSPEMALGLPERIGPWSDQYLLGAILYRILTGCPPHAGRTPAQCLYHAACNRIVPSAARDPLLPLAERALATEAADRFPSVEAFAAELLRP